MPTHCPSHRSSPRQSRFPASQAVTRIASTATRRNQLPSTQARPRGSLPTAATRQRAYRWRPALMIALRAGEDDASTNSRTESVRHECSYVRIFKPSVLRSGAGRRQLRTYVPALQECPNSALVAARSPCSNSRLVAVPQESPVTSTRDGIASNGCAVLLRKE